MIVVTAGAASAFPATGSAGSSDFPPAAPLQTQSAPDMQGYSLWTAYHVIDPGRIVAHDASEQATFGWRDKPRYGGINGDWVIAGQCEAPDGTVQVNALPPDLWSQMDDFDRNWVGTTGLSC
ncbi:hypothetical protein [Nocardia terpenica]|uniref:Uncharacterized protein n=1 Tax=Nocardia terpenica TaxID=455432 RepID=A0A291RPW2_9NOCA|nr:hypothetical protein [Nocardia terpenica]ATL69192.1 hypothetical protein CRH09_26440 [Nocardia terpenica]